MAQRIVSPYDPDGVSWLRGNLHTHTTNSDGNITPQQAVDEYAALGYDFLMISDHDRITRLDTLEPRGLALVQGNEITSGGPHLLHVDADRVISPYADRQRVLDEINAGNGFAIMNHPNWESHFNHCDQSVLEALRGYAGIEIFNGVTLRAEGCPLATDRWDMLLSRGRRVWGFANDDNHADCDRGVAWNMVQCASRAAADILKALRCGVFYASTGVAIERIAASDDRIRITAENCQCFDVIADDGRILARINGPELDFAVPDDKSLTYLRVECHGHGAAQAWTQPFFLE